MIAAWTVAINLITRSNFGLVASRIGTDASLLNSRLNAVNQSLVKTGTLAKAGVVAFQGLGVAAAAATAIGFKGAIDMQNAMNGIKVATGASADEMDRLSKISMKMSRVTGQSWAGATTSLASLIQGGIPYKQILADPSFAVESAKFMDVMKYRSVEPVDYAESAKMITKIAHQLNTYSSTAIAPVLTALAASSFQQADSIVNAATQLKYYAPIGTGVRVPDSEMLVMAALLGRFGLNTGRGGSGVRAFIDRQFNPRSKPAHAAMEDLGLYGPNGPTMLGANGQFQLLGAMSHLQNLFNSWVQKFGLREAERRFTEDTGRAFTSTGSGIAQLAMRPGFQAQASMVEKGMRDFMARGGVGGAQQIIMGGVTGQFQIAVTNFQTAMTQLMQQYLPPLTQALNYLANKMAVFSDFLGGHPTARKVIGGAMLGMAGVGVASILGHGVNYVRSGLSLTRHPHMYLGGGNMIGRGAEMGGAGFLARGGGGLMAMVRPLLLAATIVMPRFVSVVALLGTRILPVVGWILLLIQVFQLFGKHSLTLGKIVGIAAHDIVNALTNAAHWIATDGAKLLWNAFKDLILSIYHGIVDSFHGGGFIGGVLNFARGIQAGWNSVGAGGSHPAVQVNVHVHQH